MPRYIDAEKIKYTKYINGDVTVSKDLVEKIPTADVVELRRGRWDTINSKIAQCSVCRVSRDIRTQVGWNFCPVCGAKMGEEEQK